MASVAGLAGQAVRAQSTEGRTVAGGVYTDVQATRGQKFYEVNCVRCHRVDLSGAEGPPLRGDRFSKDWGGKDLQTFFEKIANTMPGAAPASLTENVNLDIVAHVLRENGFPSGTSELTRDSVAGVGILSSRPRPLPPVGDFSYADAVGCLSASGNTWLLTRASDPVAANPEEPASATSRDRSLGSRTLRLLDARAYSAQSHAGQKVYVRGLLVKMPDAEQMTLSTLETLAPTCGN